MTDITFLARFLGINFFHKVGTTQEVINTIYSQLHDYGEPIVPKQRMYAVQGTGSCELKSITVGLSHILQHELAYQSLIAILGDNVKNLYEKNQISDAVLLGKSTKSSS